MCLEEFFGQQSPFQIIVAVVAFWTALYTFYKSFLERAKLSIHVGDAMALVVSSGGGVSKFHLRANLANEAIKMGTLHRLEAEVCNSAGEVRRFKWGLFYEYAPGSCRVRPQSHPYAVSVPGKSSLPLFIQFELRENQGMPTWPQGTCRVRLIGWVNKRSRRKRPNLESVFHVNLSETLAKQVATEHPATDFYLPAPIVEWNDGEPAEA